MAAAKHHSLITESKTNRSRRMAGFLAIILGDIGVHKFYLGKPWWGLIYFVFSWTFIPLIIGVIEGIMYLSMPDQEFKSKYS